MKKYISLFVLATLMFSLTLITSVKAKDGENANYGRPAFNDEQRGDREDFKNDMKDNREAFRLQMNTDRKTFIDSLKADREAFMAELKAKKEAWKMARMEAKTKFCEGAKEMLANRFKLAITELEKYQSKIADIIAQLKADNKDTTLAQESLDLSKQKLADAKAKLLVVEGLVPDTCVGITPDVFEKIKLGARDAKNLLKESREALHQAIQEIRVLKGEDNDNDSQGDE